MTRTTVLLCVVLVTGCASFHDASVAAFGTPPAQRSLAEIEQHCLDGPFYVFGGCVEGSINLAYPDWKSRSDADYIQTYISWVNAATQRVQEGTMTEAEAKTGAIELRTRLSQIVASIQPQQRQAFDYGAFLTGLAILQSSQPQPSYAVPAPSAPITCTQYPTNRIYGTAQVVCH